MKKHPRLRKWGRRAAKTALVTGALAGGLALGMKTRFGATRRAAMGEAKLARAIAKQNPAGREGIYRAYRKGWAPNTTRNIRRDWRKLKKAWREARS